MLRRAFRCLSSFCMMSFVSVRNLKSSSSVTPRYFACWVISIPRTILCFGRGVLLSSLTWSIYDLDLLSLRLFWVHHCSMASTVPWSYVPLHRAPSSSAYANEGQMRLIRLNKSFINKLKSSGLSTDNCGTPTLVLNVTLSTSILALVSESM